MTDNNEVKPNSLIHARRSSLKASDTNTKLDPGSLLKVKNKRNSVSWGQNNTFQFKAMKAMFVETKDIEKPTKETTEKHKQFVETRRKSIKNEFSIVKEMMKNKNLKEENDEDEDDEEVKKNTNKNVQIGKDALNEESDSDSESSQSNNSNKSGEGKEKNEKK
jgi:hypothetical protein